MSTFFVRTFGQSAGFGDPFTNNMDMALLDMTPELIALCRQRSQHVLKLAAKDQSLWELLFWNKGRVSWWEFYPEELIESIALIGAEEAADNGELVELTDASALKLDKSCAVECVQMRVLVYRQTDAPPVCEFGWGAYRKHCDVWVTTPTFTLDRFEKLLSNATA